MLLFIIIFLLTCVAITDGFTNLPALTFNAQDDSRKSKNTDLDDGARTFEKWFNAALKENNTLSKVRHTVFSNRIRGLEYIHTFNDSSEAIITIPKEMVLYSTFDDARNRSNGRLNVRWDVSLALKLLQECKKGNQSNYYG